MHCFRKQLPLLKTHFRFSTFRFPKNDETSFHSNFINDPTTLYIDKSKYAAQIMLEPQKLMFFHRPRRFGKNTLLSLLRYLYAFGVDNSELKKRFPTLDILKPNLFKGDQKLFSRWRVYKEKHTKVQTIPLFLDFSKGLDKFNENHGFRNYLTDELLRNLQKLSGEVKKSNLKKIIDEIFEKNKGNSQEWENIIDSLEDLSKENANASILINEYEMPYTHVIATKKDTHLKTMETDLEAFFSSLKKHTAEKNFIEKVVMMGVVCLRHLNIFSGTNPFENFSLDPDYEYAFGFILDELMKGDSRIKETVIRLLMKHDIIKSENEKEEKLNKYLEDIFETYKGFCFTPVGKTTEWLVSHLIPPISFNNHMNFLDSFEKGKINPHQFKHYWDPAEKQQNLPDLVGSKKNPYLYPKFLFLARNSIINIDDIKKIEQMTERELPLKLLLFKKGYFSIKRIVTNDEFLIDWTSEETKNAFFKTYVKELGYETQFMDNFLSLMATPENVESLLKDFSNNLEKYFRVMLSKNYELNFALHEFTQSHKFFLEILNSAISANCEIGFDRFKLLYNDQHTFKSDEIPNFLICSNVYKKMVIIELFKKSLSQEKKYDLDYYKNTLNVYL